MTTLNWNEATAAVDQAKSILLVTHLNPDGDAIGSLLGLANALRERGSAVTTLAVDKGVPNYLKFLPGSDQVVPTLDSGAWDLMISLDSSDEERSGVVGAYGRAHSKFVINLDHHPTNTLFGNLVLLIPDAVSATQVVLQWLEQMGQPLSKASAVPLLTGLVTDTQGFRTSNVRPETLGFAQKLMQAGASLTEITQRTLASTPYQNIQLWKYVLPSVELNDGVISAVVTQEDAKKAGLVDVSDAGLVEFLVTANEAMISVVFKETSDGRIELGFRCKPGYDVSKVALSLGGGGHKQASGATIPGPLEAAKARVLPLLHEAYQQGALVIS
ncbi:MAG TPA: bifunctional oligoribonuclease/PAP phosphatase NrnA [Phototrophicaceae bacterium]|nr:bifunctional oligoribonuclease/PAP phosphatase NrnA [Phototrophicaceae bacterium]